MSDLNNKFDGNFPKVVGKIDLSQFEKDKKERINFEEMSIFLKKGINLLSSEVNEEYAEYGQVLEDDGSIRMEGPEADLQKRLVLIKEKAWAGEKKCSLEEWQEKKEKDPATVAEMFVTLLLHNKLKDRFLVSRSSVYDDYENGVDYVLMDKKTGAVVCGLDQVLGIGQDDGGSKKKEKIENILLKGGANLEYGITLDNDFEEDNDLVRKKIKNIPTFFLGISKQDLDKSLLSLQKDNKDGVFSEDSLSKSENFNDLSQDILKKIVISLEEQYIAGQKLLKETGDNAKYKNLLENFDKFKESLDIIKSKLN